MSSLFPNYGRWDVEIVSGEGTMVTDAQGKQYLDFVSGIAVSNLGHSHPAVLRAVQEQLQKVWHVSNLFQNSLQEEAASLLVQHSDGQRVFFCNSGAEANEAAIKLARKFTGRHKIITFRQSFHGRTFATMSATGQEKIHSGFGPLLSEFVYLPYNDVAALQEAMSGEVAAVLVEAVQGEGGVLPAEADFMKAIEALCREHGALFMIDEVQTGIGRTGKPFAYQHYGVSPDIITAAKALGNGIPVGAMIGKEALATAFGPGVHGSTFGGNMTAMAAAKAVLQTVFQEEFLAETAAKGELLLELLKELEQLPFVTEVRGKGLMLGVVCTQEVAPWVTALRQAGLLVLNAGPNVIRLLPPLTVTKEELEKAAAIMKHVLTKESAVAQ
ncbi:acetylornithine transaminase [Ectobacillus ponti]|uniref:Acetylornithine aminotransferase n=1 Tax=Ectobacillus ponti TaxID=2961894 RepID=A0AA41X7V1_9BACI|nr:acetylornithine transaminase [Ectobacillus ponti]MCP8966991.1 acetylornithine transaminase [Ectobacillus ponti]